jgi:hypothetical protein
MKLMWIVCGSVIGLTTLSIAMGAVPSNRMHVTDDTAIYQHLSEINAPKDSRPNFDGDLAALANLQRKPVYREKLKTIAQDPRLAGPMKRIASQQYRYTPNKKQVVKN